MAESATTGRPARQRRLRVPDRPDKSINLWSIVKNCIGKDLTKIPVPVNFSEPLSFLQVRGFSVSLMYIVNNNGTCGNYFSW